MLKLAKTSLLALSIVASSALASDILVTVNGKNITKQDAQTFVTSQAPTAIFADLKPEEKAMIKERLVEKELFTELAAKEGIENQAEFKKNMKKLKAELLVNMWMKAQLDNAVVSDSEAKEFYEKNVDKFKQPESVKARHILVKTEEEAKAIIDQLKPLKGAKLQEKFVILAKEKSTGPSGKDGGDLGSFTKDKMVPAFAKATWALKDGSITMKAVKTQFGYHVIYLEKKTKSEAVAYDEVKEKIIASLKQKQFAAKISAVATELKSKATIVDMSTEVNATKK